MRLLGCCTSSSKTAGVHEKRRGVKKASHSDQCSDVKQSLSHQQSHVDPRGVNANTCATQHSTGAQRRVAVEPIIPSSRHSIAHDSISQPPPRRREIRRRDRHPQRLAAWAAQTQTLLDSGRWSAESSVNSTVVSDCDFDMIQHIGRTSPSAPMSSSLWSTTDASDSELSFTMHSNPCMRGPTPIMPEKKQPNAPQLASFSSPLISSVATSEMVALEAPPQSVPAETRAPLAIETDLSNFLKRCMQMERDVNQERFQIVLNDVKRTSEEVSRMYDQANHRLVGAKTVAVNTPRMTVAPLVIPAVNKREVHIKAISATSPVQVPEVKSKRAISPVKNRPPTVSVPFMSPVASPVMSPLMSPVIKNLKTTTYPTLPTFAPYVSSSVESLNDMYDFMAQDYGFPQAQTPIEDQSVALNLLAPVSEPNIVSISPSPVKKPVNLKTLHNYELDWYCEEAKETDMPQPLLVPAPLWGQKNLLAPDTRKSDILSGPQLSVSNGSTSVSIGRELDRWALQSSFDYPVFHNATSVLQSLIPSSSAPTATAMRTCRESSSSSDNDMSNNGFIPINQLTVNRQRHPLVPDTNSMSKTVPGTKLDAVERAPPLTRVRSASILVPNMNRSFVSGSRPSSSAGSPIRSNGVFNVSTPLRGRAGNRDFHTSPNDLSRSLSPNSFTTADTLRRPRTPTVKFTPATQSHPIPSRRRIERAGSPMQPSATAMSTQTTPSPIGSQRRRRSM